MGIIGKYSVVLILLLQLLPVGSIAHAQKVWTEITMDRNSVFVGQPMQVTVTVYTSTWFTSGVDPGNVKVNGAFTVFFRGQSITKVLNGKTYAGVGLNFNVFPFEEEDLVFPSMEFTVETPKDGDYKGVLQKVKTEERIIKVKPVPPGYDRDQWLVAGNLSVNEKWLGNRSEVKVGDVLERRITRNATGTVAELIPPIIWDSLPATGAYPGRSSIDNKKTRTSISATRTESIRYLFEKEGEIVLPELELTWWNPIQNRLYKRTLAGSTIQVLPNPELGLLESIRDSLDQASAHLPGISEEEQPLTILGLSVKAFVLLLLAAGAFIFFLFKFMALVIPYLKEKRADYLKSEKYYFNLFVKTVRSNDKQQLSKAAYQWIDQLHLSKPTLLFFAHTYGSSELVLEVTTFEKKIAKGETFNGFTKSHWKAARKRYLKGKYPLKTSASIHWINP